MFVEPVRRFFTTPIHPKSHMTKKSKKYVKNIIFYIFSLTPIPYGGCYTRKQKTAQKENEAPQSNHATFSTPAPLQDKTSGLTTRKMPNIYDPKYDRSTKSETPTPVQKMPNIYDF